MRVELTYFNLGGKYHSTAHYNTDRKDLEEVWDDVREALALGRLPGLSKDAKEFIVLINAPEHEGNHPRLVLPS